MFHKAVRVALVTTLGLAGLSLTGCTDEELSFSAGLIIGDIIGESSHHHHHDHGGGHWDRPRYRSVGGEFQIMRGNDPGQPPRNRFEPEPEVTPEQLKINLAQKYSLSADSAAFLAENYIRINEGDLGGAHDLGFDRDDLLAISQQGSPKASSMEALKANLQIGDQQASAILADVKASAQKLAAEQRRNPIRIR